MTASIQPHLFCVIYTSACGPALIEFDSHRHRLEWLAQQDDRSEDFYSFEVTGSIDGLTISSVGEFAREELQDLD